VKDTAERRIGGEALPDRFGARSIEIRAEQVPCNEVIAESLVRKPKDDPGFDARFRRVPNDVLFYKAASAQRF